ncbi:SNF2 family helicase Ino80 [Pseudohyphozyma bogoriensis]|nr:SNF2 family helicase Ino80 [Pseudohyphozyma bogoriensis]
MSLAHLLNDSGPSTSTSASNGHPSTSAIPSASSTFAADPTSLLALGNTSNKSKKRRPSRAAAAFVADDDADGLGRRSSTRTSNKPKRYAEDFDEDGAYDSAFTHPGRLANGRFQPINGTDDHSEEAGGSAAAEDGGSDDEGNGLLRATGHIWRAPLEKYVMELAEKRRKLEEDFEKNEQSRKFVAAARVVEMSERRVVEMRERRQVRLVELKFEEDVRAREEEEERRRAEAEEQKRLAKGRDKEEKLRKQREAAQRRRDEEKVKKGQNEERRKVLAEKERLAKLAEQERRAALTPEEREAEDRAEAQRIAREKEEARRKLALLDRDAPEGRGGRKKRKKGEDDDLASSTHGDHDELEDDDVSGTPDSRARKGKGPARGYDYPDYPPGYYPPPGAVDSFGNPLPPYGYPYPPPPLPHGAYIGPDNLMYDARGAPIPYTSYMSPGFGGVGGSPASSSGHFPGSHDARMGSEDFESVHGGHSVAGDEEDMHASAPTKGKNPKASAAKAAKKIEDLERKVWLQIARKDIPKVVRVTQQSTSSRQFFSKRVSTIVAREARRAQNKTKSAKDIQTRARRVMREMMVFMKGNEKKERETRKKAEKEALDKAKKEEDMREAQRQARKLNFLITQTELYSHFVGNKIKTSEAEDSADTAADKPAAPQEKSASLLAAIAAGDAPPDAELKDLDFDVDDETNAALHARRGAQAAMDAAKQAAAAFDAAAADSGAGTPSASKQPLSYAQDDMDFQNPGSGDIDVKQPKILTCKLKEYQLKGLNWLANLYEQGINGILADEMGLGKTVQSISLMAYLAEVHNIWGPFLVIAPASTLHNWQQEITKFVPSLKALPYWGNTKDRAVLRKFWNRKSLRYDKDAPFHILVTSYQLVVQDEKYFQGVKWQYMVLDEAQAIKSSTSTRWKTLLGFRCRNRLLLTGTPIQNSMHELWALLHFIMPSLFDSHDEFSEWFSKDIEGNAEKNGAMNEHQLRRLHMILKPFMLRRIKKNVQNELGDKIELDIYCDLTPRQKAMYRTLRENISITDLVARASSLGDDDSVKRLMNLIMQFRKVCNHPELFERADVTAPLAFASFNETANLVRDPEVLEVPYATSSMIEYRIPKLLYREGGMVAVPGEKSKAGSDSLHLNHLLNIWTPDYIQKSLKADDSTFSFARGLKLSPAELSKSVKSHGILRVGLGLERFNSAVARSEANSLSDDAIGTANSSLTFDLPSKAATLPFDNTWRDRGLTPLSEVEQNYRLTSRLGRQDARFYMDTVVAPAINAVCSDRSFAYDQQRERFDPLFSSALFGLPSQNSQTDIDRFETVLPGFPAKGVLAASSPAQLPFPPMQVPQLEKLILDSGKLAKLDTLLMELKAGGHRVLVYFQMTRMIDLMEEYLAFRQYKYLRLDGGSTISERRDMVTDWQTKPELFIFLLSTRAGGLGINLTAADTVIFYDSDWNPSNDAQAMDRAHRLGQTKQVTVYRLITKDTVDERIVQLARNKKLVQDAVVGSSSASHDTGGAKANEVVSLLLGEDELQEGLRHAEQKRKRAEEKAIADGQKGAKTREENKKQKADAAAALAASKKSTLSRSTWAEDDEDAFSFFANPTGNAVAEDEDGEPLAADGAETPKGKKAPRKRKKADDGGDGEPKAKKPRKKKEPAAVPAAF